MRRSRSDPSNSAAGSKASLRTDFLSASVLSLIFQDAHDRDDGIPVPRRRQHTEQPVELAKVADRLHVTPIHAEDEPISRTNHVHKPLTSRREHDRSANAARFGEDAHEANEVGARQVTAKGIFQRQPNEIPPLAHHDFRLERKPPHQLSAESCSRSRFANDERACRTYVHDIVGGELFGEEAGAKCPVAPNIDTPEEDNERHSAIIQRSPVAPHQGGGRFREANQALARDARKLAEASVGRGVARPVSSTMSAARATGSNGTELGCQGMGFVQSLRDRLFGRRRASERDGEELYREMRSGLLTVPASEVNVSPTAEYPVVWAGLMDWHVGSGVATLVAVADGTVSLYLSSGGGVIGGGAHQDVMAVASRFLGALASHTHTLGRQDDPPLPGPNGVRFIARTFDGTLASAEIATDELGEGRHALSPVFDAAQALIAVIREASARPRT